MLEIRDLHKVYGKYHALNGLNMTVRDGALYGFVGPNGAGKTTTIKIMAGLLGADGGSVMIGGEDGLASPARLKKMIGYVPDFFGVYDNLTVSEYMECFASCYNMDGLVARKRYTALLEQVGLEDRLDFYVDEATRSTKARLPSIWGPLAATTGVIRQNTPMGLSLMMKDITAMDTSLALSTKFPNTSPFFPATMVPKPKSNATTIT